MESKITTRVNDEIRQELDRIAESEKLDRSTVVRRLLERAIKDHKLEKALERYRNREISIGKAAEEAEVSLRKILSEAGRRGIHFDYTKESLKEDVKIEDE